MKITTASLIALCTFGVVTVLGQETLREMVQREKGPIEQIVTRQFSPVDLKEIARDVDLIAAVIFSDDGRSHLSGNGRRIETDYAALIVDQFFPRHPIKPDTSIVVSKPGGTLSIDGHMVTSYEQDFPPFQAGEEYILFLRLDTSTGHYVVTHGAQGAFRTLLGAVEQVSKGGTWNETRGRVSAVAFAQELHGILKSR
ncbi:MAG TPA: hypothetical protein VJM31_03995 [Vicinamibacterales bacterium]|nr:hypothetical protein [Vicinamibacterales bacterium]